MLLTPQDPAFGREGELLAREPGVDEEAGVRQQPLELATEVMDVPTDPRERLAQGFAVDPDRERSGLHAHVLAILHRASV